MRHNKNSQANSEFQYSPDGQYLRSLSRELAGASGRGEAGSHTVRSSSFIFSVPVFSAFMLSSQNNHIQVNMSFVTDDMHRPPYPPTARTAAHFDAAHKHCWRRHLETATLAGLF